MLIATLLLVMAQDSTLTVSTVPWVPVIDGVANDDAWGKAQELKVTLADAMDDKKRTAVTLRGVRVGDEVFLVLKWKDETESVDHKPFLWDKEKNEYIEGGIEDCAVVSFALQGEFDSNMLAGIESEWDVWHWKAARTNSAGYAMDRRHIYNLAKPEAKAMKYKASNGKDVWITRPEDKGKSATARVAKPEKLTEKVVAQFAAQVPDGSAADVKAKGAWKDGVWTLELSRKLKTGNADDAVFEPGKAVPFAVALFDASEEEHSVSAKLSLMIEK